MGSPPKNRTAVGAACAHRAELCRGAGKPEGRTAITYHRPDRMQVRERFRIARLEGLTDEPRPGAPRQITDAEVEGLITRTLETVPAQGTHWSTRTIPQASGLSQSAVSRIWRAFSLQPTGWRLSNYRQIPSL